MSMISNSIKILFLGNDEKDKKQPFKKIEDFIEVSKMIDITDILDEIKFGYLSDMQWIVKANSLEENFKDLWKPIYHFYYGLCFMFESRNSSLLSPLGDTYLRMILHFNVSSNFCKL